MNPLLGRPRLDTHRVFGRRVEVWVVGVRLGGDPSPLFASRELPPGERDRASVIGDDRYRAQHCAGRLLIRRVLGARLGLPPGRVPLTEDSAGRPRLADRAPGADPAADFDFNLSHAGPYLALVLSRGLRVGIDIEHMSRRDAAPAIAHRYFDEHEHRLLERSADLRYLHRWYRVWTTREAHAKALGRGIRDIGHPLHGHGTRWQRKPVRVVGGYAGSVVALRPAATEVSPTTSKKEVRHD